MAYRKGVYAIIINKDGQFLLVQNLTYNDKEWTLPGGGVDGEESLEEALERELKEELRIDSSLIEVVGKSSNPIKYTFINPLETDGVMYEGQIKEVLIVNYLSNNKILNFDKNEIRAYKWVEAKELSDHLIFPNFYTDVEKVLREFKLN